MTLQYDGVRPVVEGTLSGDTWTTTAVNYWEGGAYSDILASRYLPNAGAYNYLADALGSTRQLMRNATHAITDTYTYDAFGNTLASTGSTDNPYRYVGGLGYRAGGGGSTYTGSREYIPGIGGLTVADSVDRSYSYNGGNPVAFAGLESTRSSGGDLCEKAIGRARQLKEQIEKHIREIEEHLPQSPLCSYGKGGYEAYKGHVEEVQNMQKELRRQIKNIFRHCNDKQKRYFGGEIREFGKAQAADIPGWPVLPFWLPGPFMDPCPSPVPLPCYSPGWRLVFA